MAYAKSFHGSATRRLVVTAADRIAIYRAMDPHQSCQRTIGVTIVGKGRNCRPSQHQSFILIDKVEMAYRPCSPGETSRCGYC
jgi:hypothetical protein